MRKQLSSKKEREHTMARKVIITCAVTGAIHTPSMSKALPVTPQQIADAAVGSLCAVSQSHQAALQLRDQSHHRRRADHDGGRARAAGGGLQA